jgi:hypothetical protein
MVWSHSYCRCYFESHMFAVDCVTCGNVAIPHPRNPSECPTDCVKQEVRPQRWLKRYKKSDWVSEVFILCVVNNFVLRFKYILSDCGPNNFPVCYGDKQMSALRITGFLVFAHSLEFWLLENTTFRKFKLFPSSGEGRETPTLRGPLERANLDHRTSGEGRETPTLLGPLERANLSHWTYMSARLWVVMQSSCAVIL